MTVRSPLVIGAAGALWAIGVIAGFEVLWSYKTTPGAPADPPREWPVESALARTPGKPTLVMLAHPRCSCTRASLAELAELMRELGGSVAAYVLLVKPRDVHGEWDSGSHARARAIPGVTVVADESGVEAQRFGARTSGQTLVYDAAGRLVFSGGITARRGETGDNAGRRQIVTRLRGHAESAAQQGPVFGCPLAGEERS